MAFSLLLAALLAQAGPHDRFIVCPGNPRCPSSVEPNSAEPDSAEPTSEVHARITATRGFALSRPSPPPPPTRPAETADRSVYFAANAAVLDDRARAVLDVVAAWLAANPSRPASIEGHADSRGSDAQNIALAGRRAEAVRDYLVAHGIAAGRLTAISYGEAQPALYDTGESVWMMNRRVEIRLR